MIEGALGINAGRLTFRELVWQLDGWRREHWRHTSAVMWAVFQHQNPKKIPQDAYSPYRSSGSARPGLAVTPQNISALRSLVNETDACAPTRLIVYKENGEYKARVLPDEPEQAEGGGSA